MKVGDLVRHNVITKVKGCLGLIIQTPVDTNNGDYQVLFAGKKVFCSPRALKKVG
tara:strand:- start:748 stop:912 length:165 start_codon:yes stop_codon:yes gene_type:complete